MERLFTFTSDLKVVPCAPAVEQLPLVSMPVLDDAERIRFDREHLGANCKHGTLYIYNRGCRCRECRLAKTRKTDRDTAKLWKYKIGNTCMDCGAVCGFGVGELHPAAIQFDHRPGETKEYTPAHLRKTTDNRIREELAKCDLVCGNCHAVRTYRRCMDDRERELGESTF